MPSVDRRQFGRVAGALCCAAAGLPGLCAAPVRPAAADWLEPPPLPDAELLDHQGRPVRLLPALRTRPQVLVNFFYTGCGTVCPPQTAVLRELRHELDRQPGGRQVLMVSISVDPLGDGPAQVADYLRRFDITASADTGWLWLTGAPGQTASVLRAFGVSPAAASDHPNLLWMGDTARRRWTRTVALQSPQQLIDRLQELRS